MMVPVRSSIGLALTRSLLAVNAFSLSVDPAGEQGLQRQEHLGDLDRAVVREQDRARADAQPQRALGDERVQKTRSAAGRDHKVS